MTDIINSFRLFSKYICKSIPTEHRLEVKVCYFCDQEGAFHDSDSNHSLHKTKETEDKYLHRDISLEMTQNIHDAATQKENTKILLKLA